MKAKWVVRSLVGLLVVAAVAGVLAYALNMRDRPGHPFPVAYEPRLGRISAAMRRFDAASEFLVEGYRDRVSAADWVQNATDRIPVMARALDVVEAGIPNVKKGLDRADLRKFVRISNDELAAIEELRTALKDNRSARRERDAWDHFENASIRKAGLYQDLGRAQRPRALRSCPERRAQGFGGLLVPSPVRRNAREHNSFTSVT